MRMRSCLAGMFERCSVQGLRIAAFVLAWLCSGGASATAPGFDSFHHRAWSLDAGAPADVWALAQGRDGYLLLGTGSGLYRFDGVGFEMMHFEGAGKLSSNNITALTIASNEDLWIGYYNSGLSRVRNDDIEHFGAHDGVPEGMVYRVIEDRDRVIWVALDGGLARFENGRWRQMGESDGYPWTHADWLMLDTSGSLWVSTGDTVVVRQRGATKFAATGMRSTIHAVLAQASDGTIWISDALGLRLICDDEGRIISNAPVLHPVQAKRLLFFEDGSLWGTDGGQGGVFRLAGAPTGHAVSPGRVSLERFGSEHGLSARIAVPILPDREGNIWVGTNLGLDRFRRKNVFAVGKIAKEAPAGFGMATTPAGAVVASGGVLYDLDADGAKERIGGLPRITAAVADGPGSIWLVGYDDLYRFIDATLHKVPLPRQRSGREIKAMALGEGALWVSLFQGGVYRFGKDQWEARATLHGRAPDAMAIEGEATLWMGYPDNRLERRTDERTKRYTHAQGIDVGNVLALHVGANTLYVGGDRGLAWRVGERFRTLSQQRLPALTGITGIAEVKGTLWLNGTQGVVALAVSELDRAFSEPGREPVFRLFDAHDGLPGVALQASPTPTLQASRDGMLWIATNQGAAWIDMAQISHNTHVPPVLIRGLRADGEFQALRSGQQLPELTGSLVIDYTATSLAVPERVRFRYRLDGVDEDWIDAGTRRQAFYTNPGPGDFTFRVVAANDDGIWNMRGASLAFSIRPAYYQTGWFAALVISATAGLLWFLYMLRLKELGIHIRSRLHERHLERERIARELHDTLLQGIQGLVLRFQAIAEGLPAGSEPRTALESALDRADDVLAEGRSRVLDLRASTTDGDELTDAFSRVASELSLDSGTEFRVVTQGDAQPLDPLVRDELFRIGREAMLNAFQHAEAQLVEIEIVHSRDELRLRFEDNGRGIDSLVLADGGRPGHWGLSGMRERAARIDAELQIRSRPGYGTQIELSMAAGAAYRPCLKKSRWTLIRRIFRE
jgi:signal transduction histidine kinase/ligand-binding sensor domain-containing protein